MNYSEKNIILIENDHSLAKLISTFLDSNGYKVSHFHSVESYMEKGFEVSYALYLVDAMLTGMSGIDFVKRKRFLSKLLPILIISDSDKTSDILEGLKAGADDYLVKPLEMDELKARVDVAWRKLSHLVAQGFISP